MSEDSSFEIEFMCRYCLRCTVEEFEDQEWEYPKVCPHCRTTKCAECNEILKFGATLCPHCGELAPEYSTNLLRSTSTSAAYAEHNWTKKVRKWHDDFDEVDDYERKWQSVIGVEGKRVREETVEDGDRKTLNTKELTEEDERLLDERREELEEEYSDYFEEN